MGIKFPALIIAALILAAGVMYFLLPRPQTPITSFEECAATGNPVMESYPAQCTASGRTFVQDIGNQLEKSDLIRLEHPRPNQTVTSPLQITGVARGVWYFEASFPVYLYDSSGGLLASGIATAGGEWMTEDFVPFSASLEFTPPAGGAGELVLQKDNPSGLPENDDALRLPVMF